MHDKFNEILTRSEKLRFSSEKLRFSSSAQELVTVLSSRPNLCSCLVVNGTSLVSITSNTFSTTRLYAVVFCFLK